MKFGIFGGTFDPIHSAHLFVAREIRRVFSLDAVLFMVSKNPPHKTSNALTHPLHRLAMVNLAVMAEEGMYASFAELERLGPSYTVDTLDDFVRTHPGDSVCFIGGGDSLNEVHLWRECDKLFREHCLVFVQRVGTELELDRLQMAPGMKKRLRVVEGWECPEITPGTSFLVNLLPPDISSTAIRDLIRKGGEPPREQLPELVLQYIRKYQIYEQIS